MIQRIEQGLESDIKKRKILYFIFKNTRKDQEEIDSELRLKIRDRFYKILYEKACNFLPRLNRKRIIKTKKDQCLKFIKRNERNIFDRIRIEIDDQKEDLSSFDPFNHICYDINVEYEEKRNSETFSLQNEQLSTESQPGMISFKSYLTNLDKSVPVCSINDKFRNYVFQFGKRLWKYAKYCSVSMDVENIKTQSVQLSSKAVRTNFFNSVDLTLKKRFIRNCNNVNNFGKVSVESIIRKPIRDDWYLLCYDFDFWSLKLSPIHHLRNANLFVLVREKGGKIDCKVVVKSHVLNMLSEYEKFKLFIVGYQIYKIIHSNTQKAITTNTWAFYYECIEREGESTSVRYHYYKDGEFNFQWTEAVKIQRFIKIDKLEIVPRLKRWLDRKGIDINLESDSVEQLPDDYCLLNIGADGYDYKNLPSDLIEIQAIEYGKLINSGIGIVDKTIPGRYKHYNLAAYVWRGLYSAEETRELEKIACGIRIIFGENLAGIYLAEVLNCVDLGILDDVSDVNMGAGNYYFGPNSSGIDPHTEHRKFDKVISVTYGELSYLSVGMGVQGYVNGLTCVQTKCGSIIDYVVGELCMDDLGHGVISNHLNWEFYDWRLTKLIRNIRSENINEARLHHNICSKGQNDKNCGCVGSSTGPFRDPFGKF